MNRFPILLVFSLWLLFGGTMSVSASWVTSYPERIGVSSAHNRYFANEKGKGWIPVMANYLPDTDNKDGNDDAEFASVETYFRNYSENGVNALRIWISTEFLEIEDSREGVYNPLKFERIDKLLALAQKYRLKVKFTLHHIRSVTAQPNSGNSWSNSTALAHRFSNIEEYISTPEGRASWMNRVRALAGRYRNHPAIYGWELWNEMDATTENWFAFTSTHHMLDSVKALFPRHMVTQTLGSLHSERAEAEYLSLIGVENHPYLSIHRYLDPGDSWGQYDVVKGPIDLLVAHAVDFGLKRVSDKPVIINEIGAVEANHARQSDLYALDKEGVLLHDMIFAPFFCGAAGTGALWHWYHYIMKNQLWYHFARFRTALAGIDPVKERFEPFRFESNGVRCYGLKGKNKTIVWCRDGLNNWQTELVEKQLPAVRTDFLFSTEVLFAQRFRRAKVYNPWTDRWEQLSLNKAGELIVPPFTRSVVVVLE